MPASHPSSKTPNRRIAASDLDARQLRAFVAVVREGSVSRAAATLGLAQSTVSEALAALDRTLGVAALQRQRGARRMPLTAAGRAPLPHAERALEEISAAQLLGAYPVFVSDSAGDMQDLLFRYFTAEGLAAPRLDSAGTIEGVRRGVAGDSMALGILPQYALAEDLRSGRVRTLKVEPAPPQLRLVALLPPTNTSRHPAIAALIALLRP